jgi:Flp pilus assembly protein TadD
LKINPQDAQVKFRLARLLSEHLHDKAKALELAKDAHSLAPDDGEIDHLLGRLLYETGDFQWANSLLAESARKLPESGNILYDSAWAQYSVGQVADAGAAMTSACALSNLPAAKAFDARQFSSFLAAATSPDKARDAADEAQAALNKKPNYVPAMMVTAINREGQGKYNEAGDIYTQVLRRYPLFSPATRNLALLCFNRLNDDARAYELATKARQAFPDDPALAKALGVLAYRRNDYARSAQLLQESVRQLTNDGEACYYLGMAQFRLNQRAQAKQALQRALDLKIGPNLETEAKRILKELK